MPDHQTPLIATIAAGLMLAFVFGLIAHRLRVQPLVGYLLAGVMVGPYTPGFEADPALAAELAEIGVILLMFGVGLHFSLKDLLSVARIAVPGAIGQIVVATLMGMALSWALGWSHLAGFVFGLALSVASTVVLIRALQDRHILETRRGRIAVGWLVVEDLVMVLALVLLPALATVTAGDGVPPSRIVFYLLVTLAKVSVFVAIMLIVGRRLIPWLMHHTAHTGSRELFRLAVYAIALGVAFGAAKMFGVSFALGAFFAGMVMGESDLSQRATEEAMPLRDAFAVLFFVSVGMLLNPMVFVEAPVAVLATIGHHRGRQVGRRLSDRARLPPFQLDRAHRRGEPRPDRRVLLHPDRAGHGSRHGAQGSARPRPGGRHCFDHPQSAGFHPDGATASR